MPRIVAQTPWRVGGPVQLISPPRCGGGPPLRDIYLWLRLRLVRVGSFNYSLAKFLLASELFTLLLAALPRTGKVTVAKIGVGSMTTQLPLTEAERDLVDEIFLIELDVAKLKLDLAADKAMLLELLQARVDYALVSPDDDIELAGARSIIYLSRDIRRSVVSLISIVNRLTKTKMLDVFKLELKKLARSFPKLHADWVRLEYTGNRRFMLNRQAAEPAAEADDE
jgi:hypothetical protein